MLSNLETFNESREVLKNIERLFRIRAEASQPANLRGRLFAEYTFALALSLDIAALAASALLGLLTDIAIPVINLIDPVDNPI